MVDTGGLLDGILAVAHPRLYAAAKEVQRRLCERVAEIREHVINWPTVYNAIQVMVNRETVHHRDTTTRPGWFDMCATVGSYGETAVMSFRNLGVCVPYDTGSVALVASRVVIHAVPRVPPDRIAYVFFMCDAVHKWLAVEDPGWTKVEDTLKAG